MSQIQLPNQAFLRDDEETGSSGLSFFDRYDIFIMVALFIALVTPILRGNGLLPASVRWLEDGAVLAMIGIVFVRMLVWNRVPAAVLFLGAVTIISAMVATFEGQGLISTGWGWWRMFRYPMIGVYAFMRPGWPENFADKLMRFCVAFVVIELLVQLVQYFFLGEVVGDNLAGTFGLHGVAPLLLFILFSLSVALGYFIDRGVSTPLMIVLLAGSISSSLGAMKLFPFAAVLLGVVAFVVHMLRGRQIHRLAMYVVVFAAISIAFIGFYNAIVVADRGGARLESYLNLQALDSYLNNVRYDSAEDSYYIGRGFALQLGWDVIQRDSATFLFGSGLGTRSESRSLGIIGSGLEQGFYGDNSGTSLLVIMQEMGMMGLFVFGLLTVVPSFLLSRHIRQSPNSAANALRFGLIIFSWGWPLWLWYQRSWNFSVVMLLYWVAIGFVMAEAYKPRDEQQQKA